MGEAKRRKEALGEKYGKDPYILPWVPITKKQAEQFVSWTTKGAWVGIGALIAIWLTVIFIGPSLGWWELH
ncbi:hypothetical protein AY599_24105 [Leptolyngbya valderiana BDU 20041]|nr:DUF2839 domain-containing protein [Geitlerinema sp. CS-897]OAB59501.1 hypothetical protein AY599_24105 [Leptolyngbya valderiana BDU 20041]PPT09500.1 hypothetical protein CKA32_000237 [Geitlerinema sp. FC II]